MIKLALLPFLLPGPLVYRWMWTYGLPEQFVRPRAPRPFDGPVTLDSDYRGLV